MIRSSVLSRSLILSTVFALPLVAQSSRAPAARFSDPDRIAKLRSAIPEIDRLMREFAEKGNVPGIGYGIVVDGQLLHAGAYGLREVSSKAPADTASTSA